MNFHLRTHGTESGLDNFSESSTSEILESKVIMIAVPCGIKDKYCQICFFFFFESCQYKIILPLNSYCILPVFLSGNILLCGVVVCDYVSFILLEKLFLKARNYILFMSLSFSPGCST